MRARILGVKLYKSSAVRRNSETPGDAGAEAVAVVTRGQMAADREPLREELLRAERPAVGRAAIAGADAERGVEVIVEIQAHVSVTLVRIHRARRDRVVVRIRHLADVLGRDVRIVAVFVEVGGEQQSGERRDAEGAIE